MIDDEVVRDDPADPIEVTEGLENVAREEVPEEGAGEHVDEETFTRDTASVPNTSVMLGMESVEKSASDKVRRPDHGWRRHEEATRYTTDRETDLGCDDWMRTVIQCNVRRLQAEWTSQPSTGS